MKSVCGFSLFWTTVVLYISNVHVIAEEFDCDLDTRVPDAVMKLCPELDTGYEYGMGPRVAGVVEVVQQRIYDKCNASVEQLCDKLPDIVATSNVGGRAQCRDDLKELVCEHDHNPAKGRIRFMCPYYEALTKIVSSPDKWMADSKAHICALFKRNYLICAMAVRRLCDRINSVLVKHYCQNALEQGICM